MQIHALARRRPVIPLTSLVDVVFILLFFFMLASRFSSLQGIELNLSGGGDRVVAPAQQSWFLQVYPDRALVLNGEALAMDELTARLRQSPDVQLVVQPQTGVSLQGLIDLMDALRATGVRMATAENPAP